MNLSENPYPAERMWSLRETPSSSPRGAVLLILYNICRAVITWVAVPLRDQEERSGYSPSLRPNGESYWERMLNVNNAYGWLIWPHRIVRILFWFAVVSFTVHAYHWLTLVVYIPA